jgi:hypothetical protein
MKRYNSEQNIPKKLSQDRKASVIENVMVAKDRQENALLKDVAPHVLTPIEVELTVIVETSLSALTM